MRGNIEHVQVCLSAMNHRMFIDVIMCMKDGLQENKPKASYISSFAGVFAVLVAKRGDGKKKRGTVSNKKTRDSKVEKKSPVLTADFQTSCLILTQTAIKHDKLSKKNKKNLKKADH